MLPGSEALAPAPLKATVRRTRWCSGPYAKLVVLAASCAVNAGKVAVEMQFDPDSVVPGAQA